ncbi:MAG TPA: hypothetical protein VGR43_05885 [Dehalococcoidia bacterium]|jgi:DNA-directed RNA polymerase subunit M/transcription elongation factor TFIIS|nr:hypothetical protein [Dehalococcoidia bacterium]
MSNVIHLKECPRCNGDMMVEEYLGDSDLVCLQCGYRRPLEQPQPVLALVRERRQKQGRKAA